MRSGVIKFIITLLFIAAALAVVYFFHPDWNTLWKRITGKNPVTSGAPGLRDETSWQGDAKVLVVVDGDTLVVRLDGQTEIVQAIGLNAPEAGNTGAPMECYAAESLIRAISLLAGKSVQLKADADYPAEDDQGRLLRYIILPDGRGYNKLMIEEGMAYEFANFPQQAYLAQAEFQQAQEKASADKVGLWAQDACGVE